ncbi:MAG: hypothetical protein WBN07_14110 [Woeseiaceae bacterium]
MNRTMALLALLGLVSVSAAEEPSAGGLDYGDFSSATLMIKGWEALGEGKYDDAVKLTEKCIELYEEQAQAMQASLDEKPSADVVNDYWALNDVGTCYFIMGEALVKLSKKAEALLAYKTVRDELYYAQAWDTKGWHWSPADAAYPKVQMLESQQKVDF